VHTVSYSVNVVISKKFRKMDTSVIGSMIWYIDLYHFQWPWMTWKVIRLLQGFSSAIENFVAFRTVSTFFTNSPTRQTRRQIFTFDSSNDADSRKGISLILLPFWGWKPPTTAICWAWIGVFKPSGQNIESFMISKLLHRFQPNFAQQ